MAVLVGANFPYISSASGAGSWNEMAKLCETVILEQSAAPLESYEPATPFMTGKPGVKEVAVYNASQDLVVVARFIGGQKWEQCLVREADETHLRSFRLADAWVGGLASEFSSSGYIGVNGLTPDFVNPGVFRCDKGKYVLSIRGYFGRDYVNKYDRSSRSSFHGGKVFRVFVTQEPSERADELCREGALG